MEPLLHGVGAVAAGAAGLLVSSVWKGLVLVACVALLLRFLPRLGAAVRSGVWTGVLLVLLLLPFFSFHASAVPVADTRSVLHAGAGWSLGIAGAWAVLSLLRLSQLLASALRLRVISRRAMPVDAGEEVSRLLGRGPRSVQLCASGDVGRPSVAGFFRPRILLPAGLLEELAAPELEHVVLHELEHLRRRDDWTNLLQKLSLALFPLHPVLLWLDRQLCAERELACDDGVLCVTGARKGYAACLARLAEDSMTRRLARRGLSLAVGLLGVRARRSELSGRVERILRSPSAAMDTGQVRFATAALVGAVLVGAVLLGRSPQLVSFAAGEPQTIAQAPIEPPVMTFARSLAKSGSAVLPQASVGPFRATNVKAIVRPQPALQMTRAVASVNRRLTTPLRHVSLANPQQRMVSPAPFVVLTAWHEQEAMPRMTLALAEDSQQTYAAVPVRGGWLLIQL